jgi:hypothetical protein
MKNGNAITAMMQKKQCPTDPRGIFGVGFFDKPQPFVPDFEEKMTVPKWFRLRSSGGDWYDEFEEPTRRCPMKAWRSQVHSVKLPR